MPEPREVDGRLEILSPMRPGMRVVLALLGMVPLLAPYELILRVGWRDYLNPVFAFAMLVSVGALAVSLFLWFAAAAGLSSSLTFDRARGTFVYSAVAPLVRRRVETHPLASVERVETRDHDWTEGAPSYSLRVVLSDGAAFESGTSWSRSEIEALASRIEAFLGR